MARLSPRAESAKDGQDNNLLQEVVVVEALNDLNLNTKLHSATSLGVIENFDIDQTKLEQSMLNHLIKGRNISLLKTSLLYVFYVISSSPLNS